MNFLRAFLDSFRERAASVRTYITEFVFGESSINGGVVDKPLENDDESDEEEFYDAVDQRIDLVTRNQGFKRWCNTLHY